MRITVWNINGLRTLKGYQPWFKLADWEACLEQLGADIACFQETKMTRKQLTEAMCILPSYNTFFNFHPLKGYSGTVTYVRKSASIPLKAEQGITGRLTPTPEEAIGCNPIDTRDEIDTQLYQALDDEGRAVVLDLGMFVLFNLYAPNETGPERLEYKMSYYKCLAERAHRLIAAGRQVMIVGDMNIIRDPIDHCDPEQSIKEHGWTHFHQHPARSWFTSFLAPHGKFHDVGRIHHPTRRKMFTCWNTLIDARPANFGVRLDYTLVTEGLLPWVKSADIQADIYGSDHCPVYVDLHDEREIDGKIVLLKDLMHGGEDRLPPPMAACFYDEFSGRQRKLASFFSSSAKKGSQSSVASAVSASASPAIATAASEETSRDTDLPEPSLADALFALQSQQEGITAGPIAASVSRPSPSPAPRDASPAKRPAPSPKLPSSSNKKQTKSAVKGQKSLQSFFGKPASVSPSPSKESIAQEDRQLSEAIAASEAMSQALQLPHNTVTPMEPADSTQTSQISNKDTIDDEDSIQDFQDGASEYVATQASSQPPGEKSAAERVGASLAWGAIFSPAPAPVCRLHQEPCRAWTVNKPGPNHGRKFWLCARPVGPGYEKSGRAKGDVNPEFRCNFFLWDSDLRSEATRKKRKQCVVGTPLNGASQQPKENEGTFFAELGREHRKNVESGTAVQQGYAWGPHKKVRPDTSS